MKARLLALAGIIVAVAFTSVKAHHAFARFDSNREVTLQGTVKEFHWTSPHAWLVLTVDREGRPEQWAIEMSASSGLAREGWQPRTLTPGMMVTATIRPLRDGTNGGQFLGVTLPDGTVLGRSAGSSK
ncbi:MAG TPA: DUF6152 family protein [Xanthobacteraceae bacterium]|jgi:hypothetical protein